jgi:hypothetical protein
MVRNVKLAALLGIVTGAVWFYLAATVDTTGAAEPKANPSYVHVVVFYVKKDSPAGEKDALIADAHKLLAKVPSVRSIQAGRPAEKHTPNIAVTDYHVALLVMFDNYEGLKAYDEHPLHKEYVDKHLPHIEKVLVYDFQNQATK